MRLLPPLVLLLLAPFVGEYLLGNMPPRPLEAAVAFVPLALLYGGGALLVREVARRLGRGYPTMLGLAVAYGLIEEGIVIQTLFNRDFLGLGLLEHGWVPALGTSIVWTPYVVGIHVVWSILVPIVLTEHLFPAHAATPWLRLPGSIGAGLVYLAGMVVIGLGTYVTYGFVAPAPQLVAVVVLAVACVVAALLLPRPKQRDGRAPGPAQVLVVALLCGSAHVLSQYLPSSVPAPVATLVMALAVGTAALVLLRGARRPGWTSVHTLSAVAGALLTYAWTGFVVQVGVHGTTPAGLAAQMVYVALAGALLALAWRQLPPAQAPRQ
ncbi:hypothetical protein [Desertihabitans aurantiacus]|uniref:hypothetical protein n=1 Tax=Desertihabitans aurantiacus TaxID=2282477 RepID=UPI000DF85F3D|nr:hypothetical protein [Desertihabitans aurantiacus]